MEKINGLSDQEHFSNISTLVLKLMYSEHTTRRIKKSIADGGDVPQVVAESVVMALRAVDDRVQFQFPRSLIIPIALYATTDYLRWMWDNKIGDLKPQDVVQVMQMVPRLVLQEYKLIDDIMRQHKSGVAAAMRGQQ